MCGRYTLSVPLSNLVDAFDVDPPDFEYAPRYNIAPTQDAPVIAADDDGRRMGLLRWGLIPSWAKDPSMGSRMINARSETVAEKPAFRAAFRRRRCLIPADGFYEWKKESGEGDPESGKVPKTPYWIHREDREPFLMAGLWESWRGEGERALHTFTILTTDAAQALHHIHPRMPVILPGEHAWSWLSPETGSEALLDLLGPRGDGLTWHPVPSAVNSPRNDRSDLILPA